MHEMNDTEMSTLPLDSLDDVVDEKMTCSERLQVGMRTAHYTHAHGRGRGKDQAGPETTGQIMKHSHAVSASARLGVKLVGLQTLDMPGVVPYTLA